MNIYISQDKKFKPQEQVQREIDEAIVRVKDAVGDDFKVVDSLDQAEAVWFIDEWEDDVQCYKQHEYCEAKGITILHDKSERWNRY